MPGSPSQTWQSAFVAMTVALGDSVEDARTALSPSDFGEARAVAVGLVHSRREVRGRTLAGELTQIAADVLMAGLR